MQTSEYFSSLNQWFRHDVTGVANVRLKRESNPVDPHADGSLKSKTYSARKTT